MIAERGRIILFRLGGAFFRRVEIRGQSCRRPVFLLNRSGRERKGLGGMCAVAGGKARAK